jgi:hypothetical protein
MWFAIALQFVIAIALDCPDGVCHDPTTTSLDRLPFHVTDPASPLSADERSAYGVWALGSTVARADDTLPHFGPAFRAVWQSQHPDDCDEARFLIMHPGTAGFGANIHMEMDVLALAMDLGRVLVRSEAVYPLMQWTVRAPHCAKHRLKNLECYYMPWSSCTLADALSHVDGKIGKVPTSVVWVQDGHSRSRAESLRIISERAAAFRTVVVHLGSDTAPLSLQPLWANSVVQNPHLPHWPMNRWWRAVAAAFLVRVNAPTVGELEALRATSVTSVGAEDLVATVAVNATATGAAAPRSQCIGVFVRHGDKHTEMQLHPWSSYANAIDVIWQRARVFQATPRVRPSVFLTTDDPQVIKEATSWAKEHNWRLRYAPPWRCPRVCGWQVGVPSFIMLGCWHGCDAGCVCRQVHINHRPRCQPLYSHQRPARVSFHATQFATDLGV